MSTYCVKCKTNTPSHDGELKTTANGKHYIKASCSKCGTTKCRFISAEEAFRAGGRRAEKKEHRR